jgi:flavorubredoxin
MWGSTAAMVRTMADELANESIDVKLHNLALLDVGELAADLVDSRAIVLGTPTVLGGMHPLALHAVNLVKALRPPLNYGAVLSSFGWNGGALKSAAELLAPTGIQVAGTVEIRGPPTEKDHLAVVELARKLAQTIRGNI